MRVTVSAVGRGSPRRRHREFRRCRGFFDDAGRASPALQVLRMPWILSRGQAWISTVSAGQARPYRVPRSSWIL